MTRGSRPAPASVVAPESASEVPIELLDGAAADEPALVERLTALVNGVYAAAEKGLWREPAHRASAAELAEHVRAQEIAVARRGGEIVGSVRIWDLGDGKSEFGLLATAPEHRGRGIGSALVAFAERHSRDRGQRAMQLELLVPRGWTHPGKQRLDAWYRRIGYRAVRTARVDTAYPQLAPLLSTPCDFIVYEKSLDAQPDPGR